MTITTLPPLYTYSSAPKVFSYSTPPSAKSRGSTLLRPWLSALESPTRIQQVRLLAQRPAARVRDATRLDLHRFHEVIERAAKVIAEPIPNGKRKDFEVSLFLSLRDNQLTVRCRVRPKIVSRTHIELLHALDFSESRRIAAKSLIAFWSTQKAWLSESGIQQLELRCDAQAADSASRTPQAA